LAKKFPNHKWTPAQVRAIAGPSFHTVPHKWDMEIDERLKILFLLPVKPTRGDSELTSFLLSANFRRIDEEGNDCVLTRSESASTEEIYPAIKNLSNNWLIWTDSQVDFVVKSISGIPCFDARKGSPISNQAYLNFGEVWSEYLAFHPEIMRKVDPYKVSADIVNIGLTDEFMNAVKDYPPEGSLHQNPQHLNSSDYHWYFMNRHDAEHFIGFMQGRIPGLRFWITQTSYPPLYT
jgi:hypothetical protein